MTHDYTITGMTCSGCQIKVQQLLENVPGVEAVTIDLPKETATLRMATHIDTERLQQALASHPKYQLAEQHHKIPQNLEPALTGSSFFATYKPILLVIGYITAVTLLVAGITTKFDGMLAMRTFMSGFFLVFSFFKMLDLAGFADSYATYDIIAKRWRGWGYVYALIELLLGLAFAVNFMPILTNSVTLAVMTISIIGVLQSVLQKRAIRCACLGTVFNLPMSTITIIEDAGMILMSLGMLLVN